jgi:hypothetical protein
MWPKKIFIVEQAHDPSSAVESSVKKTDSYKLYFWDWLASRPHQVKAIEETTSGLVCKIPFHKVPYEFTLETIPT